MEDKMRENLLRWFNHVYRRQRSRSNHIQTTTKREKKKKEKMRPKKPLIDLIRNDLKI